jgi:hypothetical protein
VNSLFQQDRVVKYLPFLCITVLVVMAAVFNLGLPNFWFDESGQFWISRGQTQYSPPVQPFGTLSDVIRMNRVFNLDPGGFTILLHFWQIVSTYHVWLRLLPFFFFLLTTLLFFRLGRRWNSNPNVAYLLAAIPFLSESIFSYAFELRAFSMEYLGTTWIIYLFYYLNRKVSLVRTLFCGLSLSFFAGSRYSEIVFIGLGLPVLIWLIWKNRDGLLSFFVNAVVLIAPLAGTLWFFAKNAYNTQSFLLKGVGAPRYVMAMSNEYWLPIILLCLPAVLFIALLGLLRKQSGIVKRFAPLAYLVLAGNLVFICLNLLNMHPWDPSVRWCISLNLLDYLALGACVALFPVLCQEINRRGWLPFVFAAFNRVVSRTGAWLFVWSLAAVALILSVGIVFRSLPLVGRIGYPPRMDTSWGALPDQTAYDLARVHLTGNDKIYVSLHESGTVRYLFEHGIFKNSAARYPEAFFFDPIREDSSSEIPHLESFDVLISDHWNDMEPWRKFKAVEPWGGILVRETRIVSEK